MLQKERKAGPLAWMVANPVAANLLMVFLLVGGFMSARHIKQEVLPEFDLDMVRISVAYPGATPEDVESGIILAVEDAVRSLEDVDKVTATASEGMANVIVELMLGADSDKALRDIRNAVSRITTFPEDAEEPDIEPITHRREVITCYLHGNYNRYVLRDVADMAREELLEKKEITQVDIVGVKPLEITVEIPQATLRAYNLTLDSVAQKIRRNAVEIPGGRIKTQGGEILLRVAERRDWGEQFADIPIITTPDGTDIQLGDIAMITDGFADIDEEMAFNNEPAVEIKVYRTGDQTPLDVAGAVKKYVRRLNARLPEGLRADIGLDWSTIYQQRLTLLLRNAAFGLILVIILLGMFLEIRLAFWVTMGIPVSFLGSLLILPHFGITINMISLFAFIMALGIVVDDAVVIGENIFTYRQQGMPTLDASIKGVREMAIPVTFSILTNVIAFLPMFFVPGLSGKFFRAIPSVVVSVFTISLLESLFVLPAHIAHIRTKSHGKVYDAIKAFRQAVNRGLDHVISSMYVRHLKFALRNRYYTLTALTALLIVILAYIMGGRIGIVPMERIDSDLVNAHLELPFGSPIWKTRKIQARFQAAAEKVLSEYGDKKVYKYITTQIGLGTGTSGGHASVIGVSLVPEDQRSFSVQEFIRDWRAAIGPVAGLERMEFDANLGGPHGGKSLNIQLAHTNETTLEAAAAYLARRLADFSDLTEIDDGFTPGKLQFNLKVKPEAQSLGLSAMEIGRQVRNAYYGAEALRQQRGRDEVKVLVKLPLSERKSESDIDSLLIRPPGGGEIPLPVVARIQHDRSYTTIQRQDGKRVLNIKAEVTPRSHTGRIESTLRSKVFPEMQSRFPGLKFSFEGQRKDFSDSMASLRTGFIIALIAIYAALAIPFKSYIQPFVVMLSIPFGIVGAVMGHVVLGYDLSLMSMMGMVALSGVVVNDSLILIDQFNQVRKKSDATVFDALVVAGTSRFRPIMLTTLTTFFGLAPLLLETSIQARFLIPMAISLAFGILFATVITLILIPVFSMILEDMHLLFSPQSAEDGTEKHLPLQPAEG